MVGEQLYGFQKISGMMEMMKSPVMKSLSIRQLLAMNYVSSNSKLTRVGDRIYMNTFTPYFPSPAFERYVAGIVKTVNGQPTPVMANFAVTANCICNCWHCSFSDRTKKNQLTLAELKDAFGQIQALGTSMIGITGGEPLLRNDIADIISLIGEKSMSLMYELRAIPDSIFDNLTYPDYFDTTTLYSEPHFYNRLVAFINPIILQQVKNSYQGFSGEYKDITCIMVRFNGDFAAKLYKGETGNSFTTLNTIYTVMQNKATRYGGYCIKPDFSDKGVVFPVLFGSPSAIENKERNAVLCAAEILTAVKKQSDISSLSIGIGTGMVYSGEFGGIFRKDYTVIGNSVNFASRLMSYAATKSTYAILLDENTTKMVNSFCETDEVTGITWVSRKQIWIRFLLTATE